VNYRIGTYSDFREAMLRQLDATANLNAMNAMCPHAPWVLSFSYARALQDPAMRAWAGLDANVPAAQKAFSLRVKMNSLARAGKWSPALERAA
jgi:fructose-bisphosphate aldolase class I